MKTTDGGTGVMIGRSGDRTRVQNDDFSIGGGLGAAHSTAFQLPLNGRSVGLGRAAAEVFHVKAGHEVYYSDSWGWSSEPKQLATVRAGNCISRTVLGSLPTPGSLTNEAPDSAGR